MIFGLGKKEASARDSEQYVRTLFAGLEVPNQVFGDPYVLAFIQALVMHATAAVHKGSLPDQTDMARIMASALDKLVPGHGVNLVKSVVDVASPNHQLHENYKIGRHEGNEYVKALMSGDQATANAAMYSFRAFVTRNYGR